MTATFFHVLTIFLMIAMGMLARWFGIMDAAMGQRLSRLLVNIFYPALVFSVLTRTFTWDKLLARLWIPVAALLIMVTGWAVGWATRRLLAQASDARRRTYHFQCIMNNYSFLPLMMAGMLWGEEAMALVVLSTVGPEIIIWTLGVQAITGRPGRRDALRQLLSLPMLAMAAAAAVVGARALGAEALFARLNWLGELATVLVRALHQTGQATIPVAAVIVGGRIAGLHPRHVFTGPVALTTLMRLVVIPALVVLWLPLFGFGPLAYGILVIIAVMPCALTSVMMAEVYAADADFAAATIFASHVVCLLTIPLWLRVLGV